MIHSRIAVASNECDLDDLCKGEMNPSVAICSKHCIRNTMLASADQLYCGFCIAEQSGSEICWSNTIREDRFSPCRNGTWVSTNKDECTNKCVLEYEFNVLTTVMIIGLVFVAITCAIILFINKLNDRRNSYEVINVA